MLCVYRMDEMPNYKVASLGLVSPGVATDGVTLFFLEKTDAHFF